VLIVSDDPVALVQTARHLMDDFYGAPGQPRLRIALHHGEVQTREREADLQHTVVGGTAILCASRVEAVVEPGQIWATEEFRDQFIQRPSLWRTVPLRPPGGGEAFNVSKAATAEPAMWVRLHRLES
jgi:class 3 adenylate cyclase